MEHCWSFGVAKVQTEGVLLQLEPLNPSKERVLFPINGARLELRGSSVENASGHSRDTWYQEASDKLPTYADVC